MPVLLIHYRPLNSLSLHATAMAVESQNVFCVMKQYLHQAPDMQSDMLNLIF